MAGTIFAETYVVAFDQKWRMDSVDANVYTDKAEAQAVADRYNANNNLKDDDAVKVLDLNDYVRNQCIDAYRDGRSEAEL